jgi:hypothetical protein
MRRMLLVQRVLYLVSIYSDVNKLATSAVDFRFFRYKTVFLEFRTF